MARIVLPVIATAVAASYIAASYVGAVSALDIVISVPVLKVIVDGDIVAAPAGAPTPAASATASTPKRSHRNADSETDSGCRSDGAVGIGNRRIGVHRRSAIDHCRVVT